MFLFILYKLHYESLFSSDFQLKWFQSYKRNPGLYVLLPVTNKNYKKAFYEHQDAHTAYV